MQPSRAAVLACVALAGCAVDPTGIRLHVETDLRVPDELATIRILIEPAAPGGGDGLGLDRTVVPGTDATLPIIIGIVPRDGDAERRVHVRVEPAPGPALSRPVVPFDRVLRFERDTVVDVHARFPASCSVRDVEGCEEACNDDDDCHDGISCTEDRCEESGCIHLPDDSACSVGRCDPAAGCRGCDAESCVAGPCARAECVDDECTIEPLCAEEESCCAGACVPLGCDDGDPCTRDSCADATGCVHETVTDDDSGRRIEGCPSP